MRYISLEDARKVIIEKRDKLIDDKPYGWEWEMNGYNGALFAVTSAVVKHPFELIRCNDCKHFTGKWCILNSRKEFDPEDRIVDGEGFCAWAERRTDETD